MCEYTDLLYVMKYTEKNEMQDVYSVLTYQLLNSTHVMH